MQILKKKIKLSYRDIIKHYIINFTRLGIYGSLLAFTVWFWYSVFTNGLLVSVLWLVVLAGIIGICINMWDMRA